MTKEQFDSLYFGKAVHCDTEEKANEFLALADSLGYSWANYKALVGDNHWMTHKSNTCYRLAEHGFLCGFLNEDIDFYKRDGRKIIEYVLQPKFKVGDKVRVKNTVDTSVNGKIGVIEKIDMLFGLPYSVIIDGDEKWLWLLHDNYLEKVEEPKTKVETTETLIDEIKAKWSEINILLNRLEKKEKGE